MNPFDFSCRTRIVFGNGSLNQLGDLVKEYGGSRILLVSDPGINAAGYVERAAKLVRDAGEEVFVFDGVEENPTTRHVDAATAFGKEHRVDFLVGLGGGSSMDCAKGANFLLTNGGRMQDYWGTDNATKPMLPMIAIPTTAGTGSETQSFALISDETTHVKMACGDKKAACKVALLDPELTVSQPRNIAAVTGMDAISHAIESYVTIRRNAISQMFSRRAWGLLAHNYPRIFKNPIDLEARGGMLLGASFAGLAIENSMLGATHSCANPLTSRFEITHGVAIGIMLPHVIRRNEPEAEMLFSELIQEIIKVEDSVFNWDEALLDSMMNGVSASVKLSYFIEELRDAAELPVRLREFQVPGESLSELAREAAQQWTAQFNPVRLTEADFLELYRCAY